MALRLVDPGESRHRPQDDPLPVLEELLGALNRAANRLDVSDGWGKVAQLFSEQLSADLKGGSDG